MQKNNSGSKTDDDNNYAKIMFIITVLTIREYYEDIPQTSYRIRSPLKLTQINSGKTATKMNMSI